MNKLFCITSQAKDILTVSTANISPGGLPRKQSTWLSSWSSPSDDQSRSSRKTRLRGLHLHIWGRPPLHQTPFNSNQGIHGQRVSRFWWQGFDNSSTSAEPSRGNYLGRFDQALCVRENRRSDTRSVEEFKILLYADISQVVRVSNKTLTPTSGAFLTSW